MVSLLTMVVLAAAGPLNAQEKPLATVPIKLEHWRVSIDQGASWNEVSVPGTIEDQIDVEFDGISRYQTRFRCELPPGRDAWLRFEAIATKAKVVCNGEVVGQHLGGWTPFSVNVSDQIRANLTNEHQLEVIVDELVGHNTQGFLPVIAPHFGGIWKPVHLEFRPPWFIDRDHLKASGSWDRRAIDLEVPVRWHQKQLAPELADRLAARVRKVGSDRWSRWEVGRFSRNSTDDGQPTPLYRKRLLIPQPEPWSPERPVLYEVQIGLLKPEGDQPSKPGELTRERMIDVATVKTGLRDVSVEGPRLLLNGKPLGIRGLLNWGYAPPSVAPTLDESTMRQEIEFAKARGFNLMKFCLWLPPKRYLELCDELGMLAWVEYPTWHPDFSAKHLDDLMAEYREFFHFDRNHPSVVLRSLTCETGPSADIAVVRRLYDLCKSEIPGAVVEDDSSWIQWNRVHDFYDDHPYGNNHTWPATLSRLQDYIETNGQKPLVLGEAIAADTWVDPSLFPDASTQNEKAFHVPGFVAANAEWWERMRSRGADLERFTQRSKNYAMLMRKFQIETFRRSVPTGGYVVSVIRDFRKAAMGLIDYQGNPKWGPKDWGFQQDHSLALVTPANRRGFWSRDAVEFSIAQSRSAGDQAVETRLRVGWKGEPDVGKIQRRSAVPAGGTRETQPIRLPWSSQAEVTAQPARAVIQVRSERANASRPSTVLADNEWPVWIFPDVAVDEQIDVRANESLAVDFTDQQRQRIGLDREHQVTGGSKIFLTTELNAQLLDQAAKGNSIFVFADPNVYRSTEARRGRFPTQAHWFLRGGPVVIPGRYFPQVPVEMLMELQHFDLAGPVVPQVDSMLDAIEPGLLLWDNHDLEEIRTHGLLFSIPVGRGRIMVSSLNHFGPGNAAGQWLLVKLLSHLGRMPASQDQRSRKNLVRLRRELNRKEKELHRLDWRFQPDPKIAGEKNNWHLPEFNDQEWSTIKCDRHWESQGYPELDDWAWYRLVVDASDLKSDKLFLNFTGVDDHYRLWVNGEFVGSDGEIETQSTAFDRRKSYDISKWVRPGEPITIAIAVYDWYGAGGIFRPVTLSTEPLSEQRPWLK